MTTHHVTVKNRRYTYHLERVDGETVHVSCPAAGIDQDFAKEDIAELLEDLPQWIVDFQEQKAKEAVMRFRVSPEQKKEIEKKAHARGFDSVSAYLRHRALQG
jgi:hypothetical protein